MLSININFALEGFTHKSYFKKSKDGVFQESVSYCSTAVLIFKKVCLHDRVVVALIAGKGKYLSCE